MSDYFPHDYDASIDDKILQLRASNFGLEGYALFWLCVETMAKNKDGVLVKSLTNGMALSYGTTKEKLSSFLDFCVDVGLFVLVENGFSSKRMIEHKELRKTLSESGKLGAKVRWDNGHPIATPIAPPMASKGKESKGKESKEKETLAQREKFFSDFWAAYPKQQNLEKAKSEFAKVDPSEYPKLIPAVESQKRSAQWKEPRFIPSPENWLRDKRWNDKSPTSLKDEWEADQSAFREKHGDEMWIRAFNGLI